jgi:hypothetical protein
MFGLGLGQVSMGSGGGSGIAYQRPLLTGQTASYRTGDDAWQLANNTYDYTPPAYPVSYAQLDTFTTLISNNAFGNKNRFTDENGLQVYGSTYIIDHLTGLGWSTSRTYGNWNDAIDTAAAYLGGTSGYSDYRTPNTAEMESIFKGDSAGLNYAPFSTFWVTSANYYHSSTTNTRVATENYKSNRDDRGLAQLKTSGAYGCRVRNHYT